MRIRSIAAALLLAASPLAALAAPAEVGQPAPDFTLNDLDGKPVRLADLKGKIVVLEWINPGCPYVVAAHTKGSLVDAAGKLAYRGAVDNSPDGERGAPSGGTLVEYAAVAVEDLRAGRPIKVTTTRAYGCGVKYAK